MVRISNRLLNNLTNLNVNPNLMGRGRRRNNNRRRRINRNRIMNNNSINFIPRNRLLNNNYRNLNRNIRSLPRIPIQRQMTNREIANQLNIQRATTTTPINVNTVRGVGIGKTVICNREFFGNVSAGFNYFKLRPGNSGMNALDYQALGFDNYKMLTAEIEFRSSKSSATNGRVIMAIDYEGKPPSTLNELMASDMSKTTTVYKNTNLVAKPGSLMKQKLHAVSHNNEDEDNGTPTSCGTVVVYVDGLPADQSEQIGTLYCYYCVELLNFRGITASGLQRLTQIVSQNITTQGAPALTPPTVISEDNSITALEVNAQESSTQSLVDGYQLNDKPSIGDSYTVVTTSNANNELAPSIRVRTSEGVVIPTNYYKLTDEPTSIKLKENLNIRHMKVFDREHEDLGVDAGLIDLFYTGIVFIKDVADVVSSVANVIIEIVKPFAVGENANDVDLVDDFSAITRGSEMEVILPDSPEQVFKDDINTAVSFTCEKVDSTNFSFSRDDYPIESVLTPSKSTLIYRFSGGDFQTLDLTTTPQTITGNLVEVAFRVSFTDSNNVFKIGKTFTLSNIYGAFTGFNDTHPFGYIRLSNGDFNYSTNILPFNNVESNFVQNFNVLSESTAADYYQIGLTNSENFLSNFIEGSGTPRCVVSFLISDLTEVDRQNAIPVTTLSSRKRRL